MNKWIGKFIEEFNLNDYENKEELEDNDIIYIYRDNVQNGTFIVDKRYIYSDDIITEDTTFQSLSSDLPYELIYKCKNNKFLYRLAEKEDKFIFDLQLNNQNITPKEDKFINFLKNFGEQTNPILPSEVNDNIIFIIGQPNTGKSYKFEESNLFSGVNKKNYNYKKIPVSGGVGNEYKGLQNTDLAITYDPIKETIKFGEFLQVLMSAIVNPNVPHVVFLDDFHNQDISSLLSEYTPLFKSQQKRHIKDLDNNDIFNDKFDNTDSFIEEWNNLIDTHCNVDVDENEVPVVALTNRVSGNSLKLVFPSNFYLLGAANFNENTLNIFADWEDRAILTYKDPITTFDKSKLEGQDDAFLNCCIKMNINLKEILKTNRIFDSERYCFGMWKIVDTKEQLITDLEQQQKVIKFFFGMIKNSLKFNNKNSHINEIGWLLIKRMQSDEWFTTNILNIDADDDKNYEKLHELNIYEEDI